jgi:hypothetical protein
MPMLEFPLPALTRTERKRMCALAALLGIPAGSRSRALQRCRYDELIIDLMCFVGGLCVK